jgi:hypothetical protein
MIIAHRVTDSNIRAIFIPHSFCNCYYIANIIHQIASMCGARVLKNKYAKLQEIQVLRIGQSRIAN